MKRLWLLALVGLSGCAVVSQQSASAPPLRPIQIQTPAPTVPTPPPAATAAYDVSGIWQYTIIDSQFGNEITGKMDLQQDSQGKITGRLIEVMGGSIDSAGRLASISGNVALGVLMSPAAPSSDETYIKFSGHFTGDSFSGVAKYISAEKVFKTDAFRMKRLKVKSP